MVDRERVFGEVAGAVERIAPGFFPRPLVAEHVHRYRWAARWVRGARVLDVASGTGYGAAMLRRAGARVVAGLDRVAEAVRFGRERYGTRAVCGDAHHLPFAARAFDVAVSFETIEHLEDREAFVGELRRVLRPAGVLLLSTPNARRTGGNNPYHRHEFTREELDGLLDRCGFRLAARWGQRWQLNGWPFRQVRGLRRLAYEFEQWSAVRRPTWAAAEPLYFCDVWSRAN